MTIDIKELADKLVPSTEINKEELHEMIIEQGDIEILELITRVIGQLYIPSMEEFRNSIIYRGSKPKHVSLDRIYEVFSQKGYYVYMDNGELLIGTELLNRRYAHVTDAQLLQSVINSYNELKKNGLPPRIIIDKESISYSHNALGDINRLDFVIGIDVTVNGDFMLTVIPHKY